MDLELGIQMAESTAGRMNMGMREDSGPWVDSGTSYGAGVGMGRTEEGMGRVLSK